MAGCYIQFSKIYCVSGKACQVVPQQVKYELGLVMLRSMQKFQPFKIKIWVSVKEPFVYTVQVQR